MNVEIWLPAMFALGFVGLACCFLFLKACEHI